MQEVGFGYAVATDKRGHTAMKVIADEMWRNEEVSYEIIAWPSETAFPTEFFGGYDPWSVPLNPSKYDIEKSEDIKVQLTRLTDNRKWMFSHEEETEGFGIEEHRPTDQYRVEIVNVSDVEGALMTIQFEMTFFEL